MPTTIQLKLYEAAAIGAVLIAIVVGVWFKAEAHYSAQFNTFKGQLEGKAAAEKVVNDRTTKRINDENADQVASMARVIGDLSVRSVQHTSASALHSCPVSGQPLQAAVGQGTKSHAGAAASAEATAVPAVSLDPQLLGDILDAGIYALTTDLRFRDFEQSIGGQ